MAPRYRSESEVVFSEAIPKGQLIKESLINLEIEKEENFTIVVDQYDITSEESIILCKTAKVVRKMILEHCAEILFPLRPEDINEENTQIPNLLYNHLASILSDLPNCVASGPVSQVSPQLHVRIFCCTGSALCNL